MATAIIAFTKLTPKIATIAIAINNDGNTIKISLNCIM